jgi:hypothetical protein
MKTIQENDVFYARWKDNDKSNHCFEGLVVARLETSDVGEEPRIILVDTYWDGGGNKWFTLAEAEKQLDLEYYCNLNDFDLSVNVKNAPLVYEKSDYVYLHSQHQCSDNCKRFYIKHGAVKSSTMILKTLTNKIENHRRDIRYAESSIEWLEKDIEKLKKGDVGTIFI